MVAGRVGEQHLAVAREKFESYRRAGSWVELVLVDDSEDAVYRVVEVESGFFLHKSGFRDVPDPKRVVDRGVVNR